MKEREISLADLAVEILLRWRIFIVWMLIGGVLLGTYSYVQSKKAAADQAAQVEAARKQLEMGTGSEEQEELNSELRQSMAVRLSDEQRRRVELALEYEKIYAGQKQYYENSVLMQIDPNNAYEAEVTYYVDAQNDNVEQDRNLAKVYRDMVQGSGMAQYIADELGIPVTELSEVIYLVDDNTISNTTNIINANNSFAIKVIHYDEELCKKIEQAVIQYVEKKQKEIEAQLGPHSVIRLNETLAVAADYEIADRQKQIWDVIANMQSKINDLKEDFTNIEWQYYDVCVNGKITGMNSTESVSLSAQDIVERGVTVTPGIDKKYVCIGMLAAAFLYAFYLFVIYVLNTRLRGTENLQELYTIPQLGVIPQNQKKRVFLGVVDQWILGIRYRNRRRFSWEEAVDLAAVAIRISAERSGLNSLYLIGCNLQKPAMEVCNRIQEKLSQSDIQVQILNNVLYDAEALSCLEKAQGAVLIEKAGATLYTEIEQELELLNRQQITTLGGVIVE